MPSPAPVARSWRDCDDASVPIITVFRSRLRPGVEDEYRRLANAMSELAHAMDGFLEEKLFVAADGERVTIVWFSDWASHGAWASHPEHRRAQQRGRDELYASYDLAIAEVSDHRLFEAPPA